MTIELKKGDLAPDFTLLDQNESEVTLSALRGKKVLIYFYPKASTPGCTTQSCSISEAKESFAEKNTLVMGISPDTPRRQKNFDTKKELGFPLLCDTEHEVAEAYGIWQLKKLYGREYMGIVRSSFLIDEEGVIVEAWYKVSPKNTVPFAQEVL